MCFFNISYEFLWNIRDDIINIQEIFRKLSGKIQNKITSKIKKFQDLYDGLKKVINKNIQALPHRYRIGLTKTLQHSKKL